MTVSGTLDAAAFNTELETIRSTLKDHADKDELGSRQVSYKTLHLHDITSATEMARRSTIWLQPDDSPIRSLVLQAKANSGSGHTVSATLEAVVDQEVVVARLLPGGKVQVTNAAVSTTLSDARTHYGALTGGVPGLLGGTVYRLSIETDATMDRVLAVLGYGVEHRR